jgi:hypothetical protein
VLNVVTGGAEAGAALVRHAGVDKIAFTGSTRTGAAIAAAAGATVKPTTLELGGKSAHLVFDDADLGPAIEAAVAGFVFNTGQFCMGGTRLLVHRSLHDTVQAFFPNDRAAYPLYEAIEELGVPAVFHTGQTGIGAGTPGGGGIRLKYSNPMYVDDVAADFPGPAHHPGPPVVPPAG